MNLPTDNIDDETARVMLNEYIACGDYSDPTMPKRIRKQFLVEYLQENLDADRNAANFRQALNLVVFYQAAESLEHFSKFLDRTEKDEQAYLRSLTVVSMLVLVGNDKERKLADEYLHLHLIQRDQVTAQLPSLLRSMVDLGPGTSFVRFDALIEHELKSRDESNNNSDEAYISNQRFRRFCRNDVPRAKKALEIRATLEGLKPADRLTALIRIYLKLDPVPVGFIDRWIIAQLMLWLEKPESGTEVINSARQILQGEHADDPSDEQINGFCPLRVARLIEFIDAEQLTPSERQLLSRQAQGGQDDPISLVQPVN